MERRLQAGFTLIEILVSLVIFLVSALGIAALVTRTVQQETESYQRVQAIVLVQDMQGRLNANRQVANCYASSDTLGTAFDASAISCTSGSASQQEIAELDLEQWDRALKGAAEVEGTTNVGALINARGCIRLVDASQQIYRISVSWQGLADTLAPTDTCGQNSYTSEARRRTVHALVQIGKLSS